MITRSSSPSLAARTIAALDQVVAREREEASLGQPGDRVSRAPDPLQERGDAVRRGDLADQVDVADVDAELERGRRDQNLELPFLEPGLRRETHLLREAAVVRRDVLRADVLGQLVRHALGQPPRVDEDQRGAVRFHQLDQARVDLLPHLERHHRLERRAGHLDREILPALVAAVDDRTPGLVRAYQESAPPPRSAVADRRRAAPAGRGRGRGARATARGERRGATRAPRESRRR
jgi:hypothetical protein